MKKEIMVRAWEIAKAAAVRYAGKAVEFFADALKQAWKEAKNAARIGFKLIQKKNGELFFGADADVEIVYYTESFDRNMKTYKKRHVLQPYNTGVSKATGKAAKLYRTEIGNYSLDFGGKATLNIANGALLWA